MAYKPLKRKHWHYRGDVSIENGGVFYNLDGWKDGYAEAVRTFPWSDGGGPDNLFHIERLTVLLPLGKASLEEQAKFQNALQCIGMFDKSTGAYSDDYTKASAAQRRHILVEACLSYGYYDQHGLHWLDQGSDEDIQIGPDFNHDSGQFTPPKGIKRLRAGTSLRSYIWRQWVRR